MDERKLENRLSEMVYAKGLPLTIRDVEEAVQYASCAGCKGTGTIGQPCKCIKSEGFGQGLQDAGPARQQTAWIDARPWIDVTDGEVPPHMLLEKTPPQNGHDIGKVFESIFKSLDSGEPPPTLMPGRGQPG